MNAKWILWALVIVPALSANAALDKKIKSTNASVENIGIKNVGIQNSLRNPHDDAKYELSDSKLSSSARNQYIRVRLMQTLPTLQISGSDISIQGKKQNLVSASVSALSHLKIHFEPSLQSEGLGSWVVESMPFKAERFHGNPLALQGALLKIGSQIVPSRVLLFAKDGRGAKVDVVAVLDIERYLLGVLAGEMPASWSLEALKAQAVASRSYALFHRLGRDRQEFHVDSTVKDQVFDFQGSHRLSERLKKKIRRAVTETSGQVLFDKKGRLLEAFYHADCGGQTETSTKVWGGRQLVSSVKDSFCASSPYAHWKAKWKKADFLKKLAPVIGSNISMVSVGVGSVNDSGRAGNVFIQNQSGSRVTLKATEVRNLLGTTQLKSTRFKVALKGDVVEFVGGGYGHGVGLCQWGAKAMADSGLRYDQIIAHYYSEAKLIDFNRIQPVLKRLSLTAPDGHHHLGSEEKKSAKANYVEKI